MKRLLACWMISLLTAVGTAGAAEDSEWPAEPSEFRALLRQLYRMQDAVAQGDRAGIAGQKQILSELKVKGLELLDAEMMGQAAATSVAGYVLSGGQPEIAELLAEQDGIESRSKGLLKGSAAYMRGQMDNAAKEFAAIEPRVLPAETGGRVALAKAMLARHDHEEGERLLTLAIAMMPGTLVEESALRRSAIAFADARQPTGFWHRTERYIRRFRNSIYAAEFLSSMTERLVDLDTHGRAFDFSRADLVLAQLPPSHRRHLFLKISREATARGRRQLAQNASRRLGRLALEGSIESRLAILYTSIHDIASPGNAQAVARLTGLDRIGLEATDLALADAALAVAGQIDAPPSIANDRNREDSIHSSTLSALEDRARSAMGTASQILGSGTP